MQDSSGTESDDIEIPTQVSVDGGEDGTQLAGVVVEEPSEVPTQEEKSVDGGQDATQPEVVVEELMSAF